MLESDLVLLRGSQRAEEECLSGLGGGAVSLAGRAFFKSHLHKGQRVAKEYTMRPNDLHSVLGQALISTSKLSRNRRSSFHSDQQLKLTLAREAHKPTIFFSIGAN
jgi:hypothetical protein